MTVLTTLRYLPLVTSIADVKEIVSQLIAYELQSDLRSY